MRKMLPRTLRFFSIRTHFWFWFQLELCQTLLPLWCFDVPKLTRNFHGPKGT